MDFSNNPFASKKTPQLTKQQCMEILIEAIDETNLNKLAESAKKHGDKFNTKISNLLNNPLVKMQL